ncbi:MAG: zinc ribbon domain-containing protein [Anaerolineae bacterium]|nr:zinc ribbon domain-containing protein [Anaerolineae bacterium]
MTDPDPLGLFAEQAYFYRVQLADACPVCGGESFAKYGDLYQCHDCHATLLYSVPDGRGTCLACGLTNPASAQFCGHCGSSLSRLVALRHCPHCGQQQLPQFAYCIACGFAIDNAVHAGQTTACRVCAQTVPADETYCLNCGSVLDGRKRAPDYLAPQANLHRYCPACGHALSAEFDLCAHCGTDASDYLDMVRALTRDRVAQVVAEEEATLAAGELVKLKRKRGEVGRPLPNPYPRMVAIMLLAVVLFVILVLIVAAINRVPPAL